MAIIEKGLIGRQDKLLSFGETGAITSANTYNCGGGDGVVLDMSNGDPKGQVASLDGFSVHFTVTEGITGATGATFKVLVSDTANGTYNAIASSVTVTDLAVGAEVNVAIPRGAAAGRFVKAAVTTTGTASAGKVSACVDTFAGV